MNDSDPHLSVVPALSAWAILVAIEKPDEPVDYYAEPVIAWLVDARGGPPIPMTCKGQSTVTAPMLRPDDSVKHGEADYPDFAAFLRHQRGDAWAPGEPHAADEIPLDRATGEPIRPKLSS